MAISGASFVFLVLLMTLNTMKSGADARDGAAFILLMPSQVQSSTLRQTGLAKPTLHQRSSRTSEVLGGISAKDSDTDHGAGDAVVYQTPSRRPTSSSFLVGDNPSKDENCAGVSNNQRGRGSSRRGGVQRKGKKRLVRTGDLPDINWRAIPMDHLRLHPRFEPLPHPDEITHLSFLEEVRRFRQDSWQWDALHTGRCTTSQAAAALGLLEPKAAEFLGIPRSLRKGGLGAYRRLREPSIGTSLAEVNSVLCAGHNQNGLDAGERDAVGKPEEVRRSKIWASGARLKPGGQSNSRHMKYPFVAEYLPRQSERVLVERRNAAERSYCERNRSPMFARMKWGSAQEATSVLTALNYFCSSNDGCTITEVGMCGAAFDDEELLSATEHGGDSLNGLKIGATPDGVIQHADGTIEALEVKNHCPFVFNRNRKHKSGVLTKSLLCVHDFDLEATVPAAYVPQLMMEMLCLGSQCTSAVMVRQTATKGAVILRVKRDEKWITEMKYWLGRFKIDYVDRGVTPSANFFWDCDGDDRQRYKDFVRATKNISENAELVDFIDHRKIQRVLPDRHSECPLFLDIADLSDC